MSLPLSKNPASKFPEDLFASETFVNPWWIAHTKSRHEKALAHYLQSNGIHYFLPLWQKVQTNRNRQRFSMMPLFSGYLFFCGDLKARYQAFKSNHIARVIDVKDQKTLISELQQIERAINGPMPFYPFAILKKGQRVRVKSGPLEGLEGKISRKSGKHRLILEVTMISQAVAIDIESDFVEAVDS